MNKKFNVIVVDCPWNFNDALKMSDTKRSAQSNYNTMTMEELQKLPINQIADPNGCVLALWCPASLFKCGLEIMEAWEFEHKQIYTWVKSKKKLPKDVQLEQILSFGMGRLFRGCSEHALIGINSTKIYRNLQNRSQRSVSFASNLGHSSKPATLQNSLDLMYPLANKIELFARQERAGWTCLGNQCPSTLGEDIFESLAKLM